MIKTFQVNSHHTSVHNSHIITAIASQSIYISTIILYHHMSIKADDIFSSLYNMHVPIYTCTYIYTYTDKTLTISCFLSLQTLRRYTNHALRVQDKFKYHTSHFNTNNYMYWGILITIFADSFNKYFIGRALYWVFISSVL